MNFHDSDRAERELARAVASRHAEAIADAATANIWPLYCSHYEALISAVKALPNSVLERRPILRVIHPLTPVLARTIRPFKPLVTADEARTMSPDELDVLTLVQMIGFRFSGDVAAALIYAERLADRIFQTRSVSRESTDGPLWFYHYQIGSTWLAAGESSRALLEFATARQLGKLSQHQDAERLALGRTALAHATRGSLDDADVALAEIAEHGPTAVAHRDASIMTEKVAAALVAVERVADGADALVSDLEPYDSIFLTWPHTLLARTRSLLAQHRPDEALEAIRLARDAHPRQHGSFATDVVHSASIDALWDVGDVVSARRIAEAQRKSGTLTRFAAVRLALNESRLEVATKGLRHLEREDDLGPGHRTELLFLAAWLEMLRTEVLSPETARQIWRFAIRSDNRRLLMGVPRDVIDLVRSPLSAKEAVAFDHAVSGLSHVEIQRRPALTHGELRVLNALPVHETTAAIAMSFHVSPNTIKSQLKSMYRKLGCSTRDEAIMIASRFRLITSETD